MVWPCPVCYNTRNDENMACSACRFDSIRTPRSAENMYSELYEDDAVRRYRR